MECPENYSCNLSKSAEYERKRFEGQACVKHHDHVGMRLPELMPDRTCKAQHISFAVRQNGRRHSRASVSSFIVNPQIKSHADIQGRKGRRLSGGSQKRRQRQYPSAHTQRPGTGDHLVRQSGARAQFPAPPYRRVQMDYRKRERVELYFIPLPRHLETVG